MKYLVYWQNDGITNLDLVVYWRYQKLKAYINHVFTINPQINQLDEFVISEAKKLGHIEKSA